MPSMILNDIKVPNSILDGLRFLSSIKGCTHVTGLAGEHLKSSAAAARLPDWMFDKYTEFLNDSALMRENENLKQLITEDDFDVYRGSKACLCGPGRVDFTRVVVIAFNLGEDNFAALYKTGDAMSLIAMQDTSEGLCWQEIYATPQEFFHDVGIPGY